jgi:hypothetical protein
MILICRIAQEKYFSGRGLTLILLIGIRLLIARMAELHAPYFHANTGCSSSATRVSRPASTSRNR